MNFSNVLPKLEKIIAEYDERFILPGPMSPSRFRFLLELISKHLVTIKEWIAIQNGFESDFKADLIFLVDECEFEDRIAIQHLICRFTICANIKVFTDKKSFDAMGDGNFL